VTIAQDIIKARDSLTDENWGRFSYFSTNEHGLCMCAHGALQTVVNPRVISALASCRSFAGPVEAASDMASPLVGAATAAAANAARAAETAADAADRSGAVAARAAARVVVAGAEDAAWAADTADRAAGAGVWASDVEVYNKRPRWVSEKTHTGNLDAHYILGMVGMTAPFNDAPSSTLDDIKAKMTQAVYLAERLGV
jgi:hypothetical protein